MAQQHDSGAPRGSGPVARKRIDTGAEPANSPDDPTLWQRLLRHGVIQCALAYVVLGWLIIQVVDTTFENLGLPPWTIRFALSAVIGGFPLVILLAWLYEWADGRFIRDRGRQRGGLLEGLGGNYFVIIIAFALALAGAGMYQLTVGFQEPAEAPLQGEPPPVVEQSPIPVQPNSIAVLRLFNIDRSEETQVFSDGLSEDLIDRLAVLPGLLVAGRGDSWSLPDNAASDLVRRRLRVAYFVEGSVRLVGDELRVVVQLIDSDTGFHILSRKFDRKLGDYLALQDEITGLIAANLRVALPEQVQDYYAAAFAESDTDAYIAYRRGRAALLDEPTEQNRLRAIESFRAALEIDPDYAAAHAGICRANTGLYSMTKKPEYIESAELACADAANKGFRLGQVYVALGTFYNSTGRDTEAAMAFGQALTLNERDVESLIGLASTYYAQQLPEEAEQQLRRASRLQPGNWRIYLQLGNLNFVQGRYQQAAAEYERVLYLQPDSFSALGNLGSARMMQGDFARARDVIERSLQLQESEEAVSNLAIIDYYLGDFAGAVELHTRVTELVPRSAASWINLADALHFAGMGESSSEAFQQALALADEELLVNPDSVEALYVRAWALQRAGDAEAADAAISRAMQLAPAEPYVFYYRALIQVSEGDLAAAQVTLERAVELGYPVEMLRAEPWLQVLY